MASIFVGISVIGAILGRLAIIYLSISETVSFHCIGNLFDFTNFHPRTVPSAVIAIEAKLKRFLFSKYFETLFSRMKSRGWLVQRTDLVVKNWCWGEKRISSNILECENKRGRYFNVNLCNTLSKSHASHIHMKRAYTAYAPKRTHTYLLASVDYGQCVNVENRCWIYRPWIGLDFGLTNRFEQIQHNFFFLRRTNASELVMYFLVVLGRSFLTWYCSFLFQLIVWNFFLPRIKQKHFNNAMDSWGEKNSDESEFQSKYFVRVLACLGLQIRNMYVTIIKTIKTILLLFEFLPQFRMSIFTDLHKASASMCSWLLSYSALFHANWDPKIKPTNSPTDLYFDT